MRVSNRWLKSRMMQASLGTIAALYLRLVFVTSRWRYIGRENLTQLAINNQPLIVCFWHGRMMMMRFLWHRAEPFHVLSSRHADSNLLEQALIRLGICTIKGSSSKGALSGMRGMVRVLGNGGRVAITPDGPKGPIFKVKPGIVTLARLAGAPILPMAYSVKRCWRVKSWDRLMVPTPFNSGVFNVGAAIWPSDDEHEEKILAKIEAALIAVSDAADEAVGRSPLSTKDATDRVHATA